MSVVLTFFPLTMTRAYCSFNPLDLSVVQDEIHKRPRISTLLENLSRYEAVASAQEDEEDGEAKTTKASQVKQKLNQALFSLNKEQSIDRVFICNLCTFQLWL